MVRDENEKQQEENSSVKNSEDKSNNCLNDNTDETFVAAASTSSLPTSTTRTNNNKEKINLNNNDKIITTMTLCTSTTTTTKIIDNLDLNNINKESIINNNENNDSTATTLQQQQDIIGNLNSPCWENLPSVILLEVFSYLPQESRIQASQVCRQWRYALFHPSFWKKIIFNLRDNDSILWSRCLSNWFKLSVQDVTIRCESDNNFVKEALSIVKKLGNNRQLKKLILEPSKCLFEFATLDVNGKKLQNLLLNVIETSNCLDTLSLGCVEELTDDLTLILESLCKHQANHIRNLSLASVKDDPDHYDFLEFECSLFNNFNKLSTLTIDYDHLSDDLLNALNSGTMEKFVIHVHGWNGDYIGASNNSWRTFTQKNPYCKLRLSLIHSYNAVRVMDTDILKPAMPLTHLKALFCEDVNLPALLNISAWYSDILESLIWIDSIDSGKSFANSLRSYENIDNPDPLVLAAWRCKNLTEIVFIGQKYHPDNLLAIVRLRNKMLKRLEFAETDIVYEDSWSESSEIIDEIRDVMGSNWKLLSDKDLPKVVMNPHSSDSREVIMPMVLRDQ